MSSAKDEAGTVGLIVRTGGYWNVSDTGVNAWGS